MKVTAISSSSGTNIYLSYGEYETAEDIQEELDSTGSPDEKVLFHHLFLTDKINHSKPHIARQQRQAKMPPADYSRRYSHQYQ